MTFLTGWGLGLCTPAAFCIWWRSWTGRRAMSWRGGCRTPWMAGFCVEALSRYGKPEIFNTDQGSRNAPDEADLPLPACQN